MLVISRSFSSRIMKCFISGTICKIAIFWKPNCCLWEYEKNCYFLKLKLLHLWEYLKNWHFFTESAAFPGIATLSINYVKIKLFNQLLQSQFIVANTLVSLDCLYLLIILNFLEIFRICLLKFMIYDLYLWT